MFTKMEVLRLKEQLLLTQQALVRQSQKCQELVRELSNRLQEKHSSYLYEKQLRENQLTVVLKALLLMEERLEQEQKCIEHQLNEKELINQKLQNDIKEILTSQFCKNCNRVYKPGLHLESFEYITSYQESSSGSKLKRSGSITLSDKDGSSNVSSITDDLTSNDCMLYDSKVASNYKNKRSQSKHSTSKETLRREPFGYNTSSISSGDNTSDDCDNFDSLPTESLADQFSVKSHGSEEGYQSSFEKGYNEHNIDTRINLSFSESNITVIHNIPTSNLSSSAELIEIEKNQYDSKEHNECSLKNQLTESLLVFDVDGESSDKWYVSASDQEDEQQNNIYRNNPVLECVNQILLQNINDCLNSPPPSPNIGKKFSMIKNKEIGSEKITLNKEQNDQNLKEIQNNEDCDDYETPIQKMPNFYETPQSLYSNDYEQIHSKCDRTPSEISLLKLKQQKYNVTNSDIIRKNKILRTPPTLPPKPVNLLSKYRIQINSLKFDQMNDRMSLNSEPDYCSISELNLPTYKLTKSRNFQVTTSIDSPVSRDIQHIYEASQQSVESSKTNDYDFVSTENNDLDDENVNNIGIQTPIRTTVLKSSSNVNSHISLCEDIPKLPSVSEIIIPEEKVEKKKIYMSQVDCQKNLQLPRKITNFSRRRPIKIGSSVSSLIMGFNNKELIYEINEKSMKFNPPNKTIAMLKNVHNLNRHFSTLIVPENNNEDVNFSHNFEEFKLDDCDIKEYPLNIKETQEDGMTISEINSAELETGPKLKTFMNTNYLKRYEEKVADMNLDSLRSNVSMKQLRKFNDLTGKLHDKKLYDRNNESTYEHFLECTGLSSKSILMSSGVTDNHESCLQFKNITINSKTEKHSYKCNTAM